MTSSFEAARRPRRRADEPRTAQLEASPSMMDAVPLRRSAYLVGSVDDPAEAAAEALASRALGALPSSQTTITRIRAQSEVAGAPTIGRSGGAVPDATGRMLDRLRGSGDPLPSTVRAPMERAFGTSLGDVRVHSGQPAAALNRNMGSIAFTVGRDVVLGSGTASSAHPHVLAHELAHTVQNASDTQVRRRIAPQASIIRRLVGFEVELRIPTIARNAKTPLGQVMGGPPPDPLVGTFFAGGQPNKCEMGAISTGLGDKIGLSSDHDTTMAEHGQSYFDALSSRYGAAMKGATYAPLSNLEYGTPALDELAPNSDAAFHQMATTIDTHANKIFSANPDRAMGNIDGAMLFMTGVPVAQLDKWLTRAGNDQERDQAREKLQEHISWMMYIQATVGVLPSGLIPLYASQQAGIPEAETNKEPLAAINEAAAAVVVLSKKLQRLPQLAELGLGNNDQIVVAGILTMAASHAIGRAMLQTNLVSGSDKNAVQLFNKFGSNKLVADSASSGVRKRFKDQADDVEIIKFVRTAAECIHQAPQTTVDHWRGKPYQAERVSRPRLYGRKSDDPITATAYLIRDWLTGSANIDVLRAGDPGNIYRPDPLPKALEDKGGKTQQGVTLEMRWILEFPDGPGQLWPVFKSVLAEVRAANTAHLTALERKKIIAATAEG